jgi:3alpha(or 20beta)-hydroxysteroid dehydrogenase
MGSTRDRLAGKVAIVTGAARGQGEAEARLFAAEGARVVLTDLLEDQGRAVADDLGDQGVFVAHDVTDPAGWQEVVDGAVKTFGHLDVLINNAAIEWLKRLEDETKEGFLRILEVNLVGTFLGIQAAAPVMAAGGGGSIINISSTAGLTGMEQLGAYGASKWGVRGLTKTAALEFGPAQIRVNSIHPGPIATPMLRPSAAIRLAPTLPLLRVGRSDEVAELALFLASDASSFITGAELLIDGGSLAGRRAARDPAARD